MLTEKTLQSLKPKKKPYRKTDSNGLCILVMPTGFMSWQYRHHIYENGKRKERIETINGGYPTISLSHLLLKNHSLMLLNNGQKLERLKSRQKTHGKKNGLGLIHIFQVSLEIRNLMILQHQTSSNRLKVLLKISALILLKEQLMLSARYISLLLLLGKLTGILLQI